MNKIDEISTFINEENVDVAFISESHDRENKRLEDHIQLEDHVTISNVYQRSTTVSGGRPAIIANKKKYLIENLTNTSVTIPWGVEMTWALLTPKNVTSDSIIQKIVLGAVYVKPRSKKKTALLDHIAEVHTMLGAKYGRGLHWMIAGDTNDLKLSPILDIDPNFRSIVKKPTRLNPKDPKKSTILDNIITTLHKWYQDPKCLPPIDADPGQGKPSDHLTVIAEPINVIDNKPLRSTKKVTVRPLKESGLNLFKMWLEIWVKDWDEKTHGHSTDEKVQLFQTTIMDKLDEVLPTKLRKISSDDQPWVTENMKKLKRSKQREYHKHRKSTKYSSLEYKYQIAKKYAKQQFYDKVVKDLKQSAPGQWYSKLKRICSYSELKSESIQIDQIKHLTPKEQAEALSEFFAKTRQEYNSLNKEDIIIPSFNEEDVPVFTKTQIESELKRVKTNKSVPPKDIPPKIVKMFAQQLSGPLCDIINTSVKSGVWPEIWKRETVTPVAKNLPPKNLKDMRDITTLCTFNKTEEKLISELILSDIEHKLDTSQYANQAGVSLQHYLINMIHKILQDTENNSTEATAVIATMIDWKQAFPRQDPKLGIEAFIKCGVRPSLIPVLISYLQGRSQVVKWQGETSSPRQVPGGGPQGAYFGILEYLAQSNENANCVEQESRFKFVDDLTILEKITLLLVGMTSFNMKAQVPSDIIDTGLFIPKENLKTQKNIDKIQEWTENQKMTLNEDKTKYMLFNFTKKHKFFTRLTLKDKNIEMVNEMKLLGVIITKDLKWHKNTKHVTKKAWARMQLLKKVAEFGATIQDKLCIYKTFVRSALEQSSTVWHSSLTKGNEKDLERVQKAATKIILNKTYNSYGEALEILNIQSLKKRREMLCLRFAQKSLKTKKTSQMFKIHTKKHKMKLRSTAKYKNTNAKTVRMKKSAIPYMENLLNNQHEESLKTSPGATPDVSSELV